MPRKPTIRTCDHPYHIWARCNNREWYQIPKDEVWKIYQEVFAEALKKYNLQLAAFVLMSNHFHALVFTPNANIDAAMRYVMRHSSLAIGLRAGRINKVYGGRYRSTVIKTDSTYARVLKYIYRNPVKSGICTQVQSYPYSTVLTGHGFRITQPEALQVSNDQRLDFFNTPDETAVDVAIKKGLRKSEMGYLVMRTSRRRF